MRPDIPVKENAEEADNKDTEDEAAAKEKIDSAAVVEGSAEAAEAAEGDGQ